MVDDRMESAGVEGDMDLEDMTPEQMKELFGDDIEFIGAGRAAGRLGPR